MSFIPWIEDDNVNATQDYNTYLNDSQRKEGFKGGTPASAIRVNTALRQANLVVTALMKALNVSETLNYRSSITDTQNAILNGIKATKVTNAGHADNADNADNATNATNADNATKVNNLQIVKGADGVLRIGDVIIPQKKILLDATESPISLTGDDTTLFTDTKSLVGRTFEIVFTSQYAERNSFFKSAKFKIFSSFSFGVASFNYYIDRNNDNSDYVGFLNITVNPENPNAMLASATKHNVNKAGIENLTLQFSVCLIYEIIE